MAKSKSKAATKAKKPKAVRKKPLTIRDLILRKFTEEEYDAVLEADCEYMFTEFDKETEIQHLDYSLQDHDAEPVFAGSLASKLQKLPKDALVYTYDGMLMYTKTIAQNPNRVRAAIKERQDNEAQYEHSRVMNDMSTLVLKGKTKDLLSIMPNLSDDDLTALCTKLAEDGNLFTQFHRLIGDEVQKRQAKKKKKKKRADSST